MAVHELIVPPEAAEGAEAFELLRGWIIDSRLVCSLHPTAFDDPAIWGVLLADVAHHIANALEEANGTSSKSTLESIAAAFNVEIGSPTDEHTGDFVDSEND